MSLKSLVEKFINYDCEVEIGSNFLFYPDGVIVFSLGEDKEDSILWKKFLKERFNFTLTRENLFTMSIEVDEDPLILKFTPNLSNN